MSFIMPKRYNLESLPKPINAQIEIDQIQKCKVAVIRFSGFTSPKKMDEEAEKLLMALESNEIRTKGEPFLMRYNPPWTLPFLRRNEVAVEVKILYNHEADGKGAHDYRETARRRNLSDTSETRPPRLFNFSSPIYPSFLVIIDPERALGHSRYREDT